MGLCTYVLFQVYPPVGVWLGTLRALSAEDWNGSKGTFVRLWQYAWIVMIPCMRWRLVTMKQIGYICREPSQMTGLRLGAAFHTLFESDSYVVGTERLCHRRSVLRPFVHSLGYIQHFYTGLACDSWVGSYYRSILG